MFHFWKLIWRQTSLIWSDPNCWISWAMLTNPISSESNLSDEVIGIRQIGWIIEQYQSFWWAATTADNLLKVLLFKNFCYQTSLTKTTKNTRSASLNSCRRGLFSEEDLYVLLKLTNLSNVLDCMHLTDYYTCDMFDVCARFRTFEIWDAWQVQGGFFNCTPP